MKDSRGPGLARLPMEVQREHERETGASKGGSLRIAKNRPQLPKMLFIPWGRPYCT